MNNYRENAASDTDAENLSPMVFSGGRRTDEHPRFENDKLLHALKTSGDAVSSHHLCTAADLRDKGRSYTTIFIKFS